MSYSLPAGNTADFAFGGVAYVRPTVEAANLSFVTGFIAQGIAPTTQFGTPFAVFLQIGQASGFTSTQFGTPTNGRGQRAASLAPATMFGTPQVMPTHAVGFTSTVFGTPLAGYNRTQQATGFLSGAFGTPTGVRIQHATGFISGAFGTPSGRNIQRPVGFTSTVFGTPRIYPFHAVGFLTTNFGTPQVMPTHAVGFTSTAFGTPKGWIPHWAAAIPPGTRFGTPSTPTNRTMQAQGWLATRMGDPVAIRRAPGTTAQGGLARGFNHTMFGTPTLAGLTVGQASGFLATMFGTPKGSTSDRCIATAIAPQTTFGTPTALTIGRATGWRPTVFGTPTSGRGQRATSLYRPTRFGLPTSSRSNTYTAVGINASGKFGHPTAFIRFNYPATGFCGTQFGTPTATQSHRVTGIAPGTRFGKPMLARNPTC